MFDVRYVKALLDAILVVRVNDICYGNPNDKNITFDNLKKLWHIGEIHYVPD